MSSHETPKFTVQPWSFDTLRIQTAAAMVSRELVAMAVGTAPTIHELAPPAYPKHQVLPLHRMSRARVIWQGGYNEEGREDNEHRYTPPEDEKPVNDDET